jgi:L-ascorbate metabolism protein UlaG (beta-lactamase superfamily)
MFKILILISVLFLPLSQAWAKVEVRWFTVASLVLEDEDTKIFFDPMFTRAGIQHWLNLSELKSDEALVASVIKEHKLEKVNALFASHSHFDHVIDAPMVSKLTGGTFYVDASSERIARAYKDSKIKTERIENLKPIKIGKFTVTPILRTHAHIRSLGFTYLAGPVPENFNFGFYDYHMGEVWFYYIEHPSGTILVDQGSEPFLNSIQSFSTKIDVVIQGVANRESDEATINGYTGLLKPSIFIPTHFDNFVFGFNPKSEVSYLPGVKVEELLMKMRKVHPDKKIVFPKYAEKIELFK